MLTWLYSSQRHNFGITALHLFYYTGTLCYKGVETVKIKATVTKYKKIIGKLIFSATKGFKEIMVTGVLAKQPLLTQKIVFQGPLNNTAHCSCESWLYFLQVLSTTNR